MKKGLLLALGAVVALMVVKPSMKSGQTKNSTNPILSSSSPNQINRQGMVI